MSDDDDDALAILALAGAYWLYSTKKVIPLPCIPNWQCEKPANGFENDGCGNRRANSRCNTGACTPNWQCESPLNGYEFDGCGNRRLNVNCNPTPIGDCIQTVPYYEQIVRKKGEGAWKQTGKVLLFSNNWGIKATDTRLYQRYWMKSDCNFGFEWNRPEGGSPAGINVGVGELYMPAMNTWTAAVPIKISNIITSKCEVGYKWIATPTGSWDNTFGDLWVVKGSTYVPGNRSVWEARLEIMIWFDWSSGFGTGGAIKLNDGFHDYGTWEAKCVTSGDKFQYCRNRINFMLKNADNMPPNNRQHYIKMDVRKMLDYCIRQGLCTADDYLISYELLLETYVGTGNIEFNRFNIEVNGHNMR